MASSRWLGSRPRMPTITANSSSVSPSARCTGSVAVTSASGTAAMAAAQLRKNDGLEYLQLRCSSLQCREMATRVKGPKTPMSDEHKEALALGREQGRAVRRYLEALEAHRPKRGRKRTPESMQKRLAAIEDKLVSADPLTRVQLIQERMDLQNELATKQDAVDLAELEEEFVVAAASYGERKGISYAAWREAGVDAAVLRRAGVTRGAL